MEARLLQPGLRCRARQMIDQHADRHCLDPGHEQQQLVVLDLQVQEHVLLCKLFDQPGRRLVIVDA